MTSRRGLLIGAVLLGLAFASAVGAAGVVPPEAAQMRLAQTPPPAQAPPPEQKPPPAQTPPPSQTPAPGQTPPAQTPPPGQTSGKPPEPTGLQPLDLSGGSDQVASGTAFNPAMSVVPDMLYYADSRHGDSLGLIGRADGFNAGHALEAGDAHGGNLVPGFNLRELEVALSGAVDPYFDAMAIIAISRDGVGLEEAFVRTRRLPAGLQLKAGKFLSDVGYINRQHPHQWDFVNRNLAHELILGGEGLNEVGVQATWLPALPVYLLLGAEALQGENESVSNYLGGDEAHPYLTRAAGPRLFTGFAKVSPDLGFNHALQIGTSVLRSRRHQEDLGFEFVEGGTWVIGFDAVYKFDSPKAFGEGDLTVHGEYLRRMRNLAVVDLDQVEGGIADMPRHFTQDGFYVQGTYGLAPRWTASLRYDLAGLANHVDEGGVVVESFDSSRRFSASVAFNPTHFSRLRFQVDRASIAARGTRQAFSQAYVQLQLSLGVHGAHRF